MKATADLRHEHEPVLSMLLVLESFAARMAAGEPPPSTDLSRAVEFLRVFVDRCHHAKEEEGLFPAVRKVADPDVSALLDRLLAEHEEGRGHVAVLAAASGLARAEEGVPSALPSAPACRPGEEAEYAINGYIALLRPHIVAEGRILFPWADRTLAAEVQEELQLQYDRVEADVIGPGRHEAFEALLEELHAEYVVPERG